MRNREYTDPGIAEVYGEMKNREYPKLTAMSKW
jgi:hypothetical protein